MKRVTPSFLLVLCYAVLMTGIALGSVARGQSSGVGYIQLDSDYTWHYLGVTTPTPEEFTPVPTNTPTPTLTPSPTATPIPLCQGTTTANLNVRSGPGYMPGTNSYYPNLTNADGSKLVYPLGFTFAVMGWVQPDASGIWLKTAVKSQVGWVSAAYVTLSAGCKQEFPDYPF